MEMHKDPSGSSLFLDIESHPERVFEGFYTFTLGRDALETHWEELSRRLVRLVERKGHEPALQACVQILAIVITTV